MAKEIFNEKQMGNVKSLEKLKNVTLPKKKYFVDGFGTVYSKVKDGYIKMAPFTTKDGYIEYVLTDTSGKKRHLQGHRLVGLMFISNPKNKPHVNHKDGNRSNNRIGNLEWVTISENAKHSYTVLKKKPNRTFKKR